MNVSLTNIAFVRGFDVTFPFDGTATYDRDHHLASLLNLSHGFASIISMEALIEILVSRIREDR